MPDTFRDGRPPTGMLRTGSALLVLWLCLPVPAAALSIAFSGAVDGIVDPGGRLDGSVALGTPISGLYVVDPTPSGQPGELGAAQLTFAFGSYGFDAAQTPHLVTLTNDLVVGPTVIDIWLGGAFTAAGIAPAVDLGPDGAGFEAELRFIDATHTMITGSEAAPFVVSDLAGWTVARVLLNGLVSDGNGGTEIGPVQVSFTLDTWQVVPEPATGALVALGLLALRRRAQATARR